MKARKFNYVLTRKPRRWVARPTAVSPLIKPIDRIGLNDQFNLVAMQENYFGQGDEKSLVE